MDVESLPSWERGLKHLVIIHLFRFGEVAPFMGAWIETSASAWLWHILQVAPFMGAWIETRCRRDGEVLHRVAPFMGAWIETLHLQSVNKKITSLPSWERGLKRCPHGKTD